jgi:hypothetical protein
LQPTIFVSIASYRDPDCQNTVRDLFEKATHPDRVSIGICWQFVPVEDNDCFTLQTRPAQVRTIEVHASESKGACWARHKVQSLWQGEDYYLQIDSHMRFVQGWDEILIAMLGQCDSPKPVLSTYPLQFTPPDKLGDDGVITIYPKEFDEFGVLTQRSEVASMKDAPPVPRQNAFIGAGWVFAKGSVVEEVPYDPYLYFEGEEITLAVRLWTHGWDIFIPNAVVAYHDYGRRPERPRHWKDQTDWAALNQRARTRIRHILGIDRSGKAQDLAEIDKYGLGSARSLAAYEAFSGVDFRACTGASHCPSPNSPPTSRRKRLRAARYSRKSGARICGAARKPAPAQGRHWPPPGPCANGFRRRWTSWVWTSWPMRAAAI